MRTLICRSAAALATIAAAHGAFAAPAAARPSSPAVERTDAIAAIQAVTTQHYDNLRTGANLSETTLTPTSVDETHFGKIFTRTLDADVNGQVLYVPALMINGAQHNVIFAYTSNNVNDSPSSMYAFDADDPAQSAPLWRHQFAASAQWTTCTPVIDVANKTIYVVTKSPSDSGPSQLRALDLLTGAEQTGSPVTITGSMTGKGAGASSGVIEFDTTQENCRPGLLLLNGDVYVAFAHMTDSFPYHGWIFGYHYDGTSFKQTAVYCTSRNGTEAGIWMAGMGLAADSAGSIYCGVGNGTFDAYAGGSSYGMCVLKLSTPGLVVKDWFAAHDEQNASNADEDLGSAGVIGIPNTNPGVLFTGASKSATCLLLNSANLGKYTASGPDKVLQRIDGVGTRNDVGQNPVVWDAGSVKYVYVWPNGAALGQFLYQPTQSKFSPATFNTTANITSGGSMTVSANGSTDGILWAVGNDHIVRSFDATDLTKTALWTSSTNSTRDALPSVGHFQFPTVANGKLYVPTGAASIVVYGELGPS